MYDQRLSNRENHRQLEGVSAPPAINIRVHRNKGNMPYKKWKRDTRRKIIVGGAVLAEMQMDPEFAHLVQGLLARYVERPNDRADIADLLQSDSQSAASADGLSLGG
jgi:hypothetical protein